jgi:hypothetical protein
MVMSLSPTLSEPQRSGLIAGLTRPSRVGSGVTPVDSRPLHGPSRLDPEALSGLAQLERISLVWQDLPDRKRRAWLRSREIVLTPATLHEDDIALLPGGAVTVRGPDAILVCDPAEATTFDETEAARLRRVLRGRADVATLLHGADGVVLCSRIPKSLPSQAVTIVPDAAKLPIRISFAGAFLIQWGVRGAVGWPLVEAPAPFALAASIAASPLVSGGQEPIASETWQAPDVEGRFDLIAPALTGHMASILGDTVCDELRQAIADTCVEGEECLARQIAEGLAMLPACFVADPDALPGAPPGVWRQGIAHIQAHEKPLALLGMDNGLAAIMAMRALRDSMEDAELLAFGEDGAILHGGPVALHSDAALFLARKAGPRGRLGVIVAAPALPVDLYALAYEVAARTGERVTGIAPCWGFCHRIGPEGEEAGNAGWFGMGAGLDEMDALLTGFELRA